MFNKGPKSGLIALKFLLKDKVNSVETIFKGLPFILVQNKKPSSGFHHLKKTLKRLGLDPVSVFQGHHPSLYPVI